MIAERAGTQMSSLRKENTGTADELVENGQRFYDEHLRAQLEPEHTGRYVAIEPAAGRYFLGNTGTEALIDAHRALPNSLFYLARVGHAAADTLSGYGRRDR
jgi:hypothetical protein